MPSIDSTIIDMHTLSNYKSVSSSHIHLDIEVDFTKKTHIQEFNWNGEKLTVQSLDNCNSHLWTSSSLYSELVNEKRHNLLLDWGKENQNKHYSKKNSIIYLARY